VVSQPQPEFIGEYASLLRGIPQGHEPRPAKPEGFRFLKIAACGLLLWFGEIENEFQFC